MLKLRNAVLTALLAFCLAMPFVSCSFNDGATGDVSGDVKVQSDNNQNGGNENPSGGDNGGNGGSTGGNEKPSGGDEDSGDNGNENPSGGNNGGSGNENPSGGNEKPTDPTEPGAGTTYVVIYNGAIIEGSLSENMWFYGVEKVNLKEGDDYTIDGKVITLTDSGYQKVLPLLGSSGGDGGDNGGSGHEPPSGGDSGTEYPGTEYPGTEYPGTGEPGSDGETMYTVTVAGEPLMDENGEVVKIPAAALSAYKQKYGLVEDTDYTIDGTVITLTDSGFNKLSAAGSGAGE